MPHQMFSDLGVKSKRGCTGISDPGYNFSWDATARVPPATVSNLDTPPAHRPAGLFFQVNVVPVEWRAIGTIRMFSANRCAGVLPRHTAVICARRDGPCRQQDRLPRVMERFGHKPNIQVLPGSR